MSNFKPHYIKPVKGVRRLAITSDTHLGSNYCMRRQLRHFIEGCYEMGIRTFLHPGDILDGTDKHNHGDLTAYGLQAQTEELYETIPDLPITFLSILGNHDNRFDEAAGLDTGKFIANHFSLGKKQVKWKHLGSRQAFIKIGKAVIDLWHPGGKAPTNVNTALTNRAQGYAPGEKPDFLLCGHYHKESYVRIRGIHCIACPTFQSYGGSFGNSLVRDPAMGGTILSWSETDTGIRAVNVQFVSYYPAEPKRLWVFQEVAA